MTATAAAKAAIHTRTFNVSDISGVITSSVLSNQADDHMQHMAKPIASIAVFTGFAM